MTNAMVPNDPEERGSSRLSPLLITAIVVAVIGFVLAGVGLIVGGPDEERRASLRADVDSAQTTVAAANDEFESTLSQSEAYVETAQEIQAEGEEFCGCGTRARKREQEFSEALLAFLNNPSDSTEQAAQSVAQRATKAGEDLDKSLTRLRILSVSLPPPPGG